MAPLLPMTESCCALPASLATDADLLRPSHPDFLLRERAEILPTDVYIRTEVYSHES